MRSTIVTIAFLLGLPSLALAAPAPRKGWKDPYGRPAAKPLPRRATPAPRGATPRRAAPAPKRATPATTSRRAAPGTTPTPARRFTPLAARPETRRATPTTRPDRTGRATKRVPRLPPSQSPTVDTPAPRPSLHRRRQIRPPRKWHLRLTAASHSLLIRHASLNPLKGNDLFSQGGVNGGVELWLLPRLVVGAEVGWVGGRFEDSVFGSDTTEVNAHSLRLGARVGYRLWNAVTPYVRGGFSATWLSARIRTDTQSLGGRSFAPGAYALAGVEFTIRRSWMRRVFRSRIFTMGVVFEAGWVHLGQFKLDGGKSTGALVDDYRAGLGRLNLHGVTVNAGLVLAF